MCCNFIILYLIFYSQSEHLYNVIKSAAVICDLAKKGVCLGKKKSSSVLLFISRNAKCLVKMKSNEIKIVLKE